MSWIGLELFFFPSFCKKVQEPSFWIKVRVNQTFFSLNLIIRGIKIGFDYDEIRLIWGFFRIHSFAPIVFVIPSLDKISCGFSFVVVGNIKFRRDLFLQFKVHYLPFFFIIFLGISIQIIDKFNFCVSLILEFLWNSIHVKIYLLKVLRHKTNIGGSSNFVSGQYVDFWGKVFVKGRYADNFCIWWVAHRYTAEAFSIHIKRKLQEQNNMNVM